MNIRNLSGLLTLCLVVIGCSSVIQSNRVGSAKGKTTKQVQGLCYSLPKVMVHLECQLTNILLTNINGNFPISTVDTWSTNQIVTNGTGPGVTNTFTSVNVRMAATNLNYTVTNKTFYTISLTELTVPDENYIYSLKLGHQPQSSDAYSITVSSNGFITTLNATNDDRTTNIVRTIAATALEIYKLTAGGFGTLDKKGKTNRVTLRDKIDLYFDPTDAQDVLDANKVLGNVGTIKVTAPTKAGGLDYAAVEVADEGDGVFYRAKQPWRIKLENANTVIEKVVLIPNKAPVMSLKITRAAFVKKTSQVSFVDGYPTQFSSDNPSEIEALVQMPYEIVKSVATLPTNILQLKIDYSSANQRLLTAQKSEIDAMTNLIAAQQRLIELQRTNTTTGSTNH